MTAFPEPNGYLHIGHAKSICLNFGLAEQFGGRCNLRFDDTNPAKEETEYVRSIQEDVRWLGFHWAELRYASDYFAPFHAWACELIRKGLAYVDSQSPEEIRSTRGHPHPPGGPLPLAGPVAGGEPGPVRPHDPGGFDEVRRPSGQDRHEQPQPEPRDPVLYRILKRSHHRTGDTWCVYPMYDFAHGFEDAIEGVTHSICTLEFQDHRPLYDWFLENVSVPSPAPAVRVRPAEPELHRHEQAPPPGAGDPGSGVRLGRPRMPTLSGLRRLRLHPRLHPGASAGRSGWPGRTAWWKSSCCTTA